MRSSITAIMGNFGNYGNHRSCPASPSGTQRKLGETAAACLPGLDNCEEALFEVWLPVLLARRMWWAARRMAGYRVSQTSDMRFERISSRACPRDESAQADELKGR